MWNGVYCENIHKFTVTCISVCKTDPDQQFLILKARYPHKKKSDLKWTWMKYQHKRYFSFSLCCFSFRFIMTQLLNLAMTAIKNLSNVGLILCTACNQTIWNYANSRSCIRKGIDEMTLLNNITCACECDVIKMKNE